MICRRVWLGWDDGTLFMSDFEQDGLDEALVPVDLLDSWDATHKALMHIESAVWAYRSAK